MISLRFVSRRNIHQIRQFHKCIVQQADAATATVSETSASVSLDSSKSVDVSPKIDQIANQIIGLNLIEVAQLSEVLKKRLNLPDAPMMPMGGFVAAATAEEEEVVPQVVQTSFAVKLTGFDETKKIGLIKELKNILPDCNLVKAKKFVDALPGVIQSNIQKEEAEKLKGVITSAGGVVEIE
ncbi:mitochondrial ribosomal protein L12 [Lasioglossum baleicum]|uniref:mitochondrial ribosomal protein L12 n=1 Tax=Lasioglossum baleicum TaxID=434251 RepID=UPI003FCCB6DE